MADILLDMKNITKQFPGVKALDRVNLQVKQGEIHALCGENGAGKSTLMKVLSGVYEYGSYEGEIYFHQELCMFKDVKQSEEKGIAIIHQELALIPELTISENIFLGHERGRFGIVDWDETTKVAERLLKKVNLSESVQSKIKHIGVGKQQLVEIAKALAKNVKLLILDEPTASLNETDSQNLLNLLIELKQEGITSIIISHKLNEIKQVADEVTIIRDGQTIETLDVKAEEVTEDRIIKGMVGRSLSNRFPDYETKPGETILQIKNWNVYHPIQRDRQIIYDAALHVKKGEIVGIAGLMGAGRTELAMSMFGGAYGSKISGSLTLNGNDTSFSSVSDAIKSGLAYATEDRKSYGLILMNDVKENISLASLNKLSSQSIIREVDEVKVAEEFRKKMRIKTPTIQQETGNLSGGNQQKVVLSKWIFSDPDVLILDEPTRGIDVGAKYEIYTIIQELAEKGKGIIMISSELPELIGMCSRVYAMNKGHITGEVQGDSLNQEDLMRLMTKEVATREDISYNRPK
ncbi:multiple monosaccharide ABC transporter ATP-binding protein [Alkalicoccobacillus murimartini]|uniref:Multiple sugar transport system ATP-binding protein n=1 Tax=Alkalicoccobacillus murimartini TaxID=171685 RepID=A0ABT9YGP5_9BACI|nr:multiple monosaccharide ABC transporter ATP-binding protein [Alkalicoccobacillus murimartini]MDQ0206874.1 putative multiple sugar transport system ATP-binding protein [Alkalicoccobacillus murimartini]